MTPPGYQTIGSYLDAAFFFIVGLLGVLIPKKLIGTKGTEEERQKKVKILQVCGICMMLGSIAKLLIEVL